MPRRKQDCPKRMKWELENLAAANAGIKKEVESSDGSDDGDKSSDSEESQTQEGSESRDSGSPPSRKSPSPLAQNGAVLDFSQRKQSRQGATALVGDSPLDLSVSHKKNDEDSPPKKLLKWGEGKPNWNGSSPSPDMGSKALEKMSELSRVGQTETRLTSPGNRSSSSSSWQAQWLAQSSCGTRDVLRCVCCRVTFPSLSALSSHMKEAKHGPSLSNLTSPKATTQQPQINLPPPPPAPSNTQQDSSLLLKETVHLPRKLVRGQDVWLGKGAEQTRQILKCMWCGQSFRSLAEMTSHMQQTQHYTNIISQEQLISWRSSEDKSSSTNSHVSAVLTCKVCDQAFSSLKELSNHMVKNSHYKEHIMRSITESGSRRRQSREKRKKSLPVRKLLELERANSEMKKEIRISCEKCGEKIPAPAFVEHLRVCEKSLGGSSGPPTPTIKSPKKESSEPPQDLTTTSTTTTATKDKDEKKESSVLNAIEKMIEKSFDYRTKGMNNPAVGPTPPVGTSILKRLGIDESVDYTKPLVDPSVLPVPPRFPLARPRSVSSEKSDEISKIRTPSTPSPIPETKDESPKQSKTPEAADEIKADKMKFNSLSALSSMFESIGGNHEGNKPPTPTGFQHNSHHPLAALQKLCDKTENTPVVSTSSRPTSTSSSNPQSSPGVEGSALLGLNWSMNDGENVLKCTFCETPFLSKGAYRHHLAKMHFIKEKSPGAVSPKDESQLPSDSPTSKFIKYTELAKQLSSK